MRPRLKYHFEPEKGWINDPNGLVYFNGMYHAFFQHNPHAPKWGQMHWGHAVSKNLIDWEELPIALYPDKDYENTGGCYSGSAIVHDGMLYLFYTSVSQELNQTQSVAFSKDGVTFEKYENNPVIRHFPVDGSSDFRDPKVTEIDGTFYMVCGSGKDGIGKILLYSSTNLLEWNYVGVLFEGKEFGCVLECPDFFPFQDKYILMFSQIGRSTRSTMFVYGDFDGKNFRPISFHTPEIGPHFYAPQTFSDALGRRIVIGWLYSWQKKLDEGVEYAGALSIPREIKMRDGKISTFPVSEAANLLTTTDELVQVEDRKIIIRPAEFDSPLEYSGDINSVDILRDTKTIELFINKGEASFSYWI